MLESLVLSKKEAGLLPPPPKKSGELPCSKSDK